MRTESKTVRVIPYGRRSVRMQAFAQADVFRPLRVSKTWRRFQHAHELWHLLVAFSDELDEEFVRTFRERATPETRLLVLNARQSSDTLLSRMVDLQIRSPHRFYVADLPFPQRSEKNWEKFVLLLLTRLNAALGANEQDGRILDARLEDGMLHVISPDFKRLEVPLSRIPALAKAGAKVAASFEIDEDGSYVYWPDFDLHLGWEQLTQIVDPAAVHKAKQKSHEFNVRYGAAIRELRESQGLSPNAIPALSDKQLRRIERGECRLTSNAAESLAKAHGMQPNEYLQAVAALLK